MMSTERQDALVEAYLRQLAAAARVLPSNERQELVADIQAHLAAGIRESGATEAAVRNLLDKLGSPEEVVAAARAPGPSTPRAGRELATVILLLAGGIVFVPVAWIVGVVMLWTSPAWPTSRKWLGTLVWPGGLALPLAGFGLAIGNGALSVWVGLPLLLILLVPPIVVAVHLIRTARR